MIEIRKYFLSISYRRSIRISRGGHHRNKRVEKVFLRRDQKEISSI